MNPYCAGAGTGVAGEAGDAGAAGAAVVACAGAAGAAGAATSVGFAGVGFSASLTALFSARRAASSFILSRIPWAEAEVIPHIRIVTASAARIVVPCTIGVPQFNAGKAAMRPGGRAIGICM
jgi:hypothetical protein